MMWKFLWWFVLTLMFVIMLSFANFNSSVQQMILYVISALGLFWMYITIEKWNP